MSKHTPGPWQCVSGAVETRIGPQGAAPGIPIASMDREPGNGTLPVERDANARLIAAAPDLLEAAKAMVTDERDCWCVYDGEIPGVVGAHICGHCELRAAIAKAEGE